MKTMMQQYEQYLQEQWVKFGERMHSVEEEQWLRQQLYPIMNDNIMYFLFNKIEELENEVERLKLANRPHRNT